MPRADQITDPVAFHGEGPVWWPGWGGLRYVDLFAGDVMSLHADGFVGRRHLASIAGAIRPRAGGGMVVGVERGFMLDDGAAAQALPELWSDTSVRMNDGGCDPDGRFYCGSMSYDDEPGRGRLYRLDADGSTSVVLHGVSLSNGIEWSPDGTTVYYIDTPTQRIDAFDYSADKGFANRRPFVDIAADAGHPDGLTVDSEGCVWVALYAGSAVRRYRPDGVLDGIVELPVTQVTACTFGGANLDELYITTSRENLPADEQPEAGALFRYAPGVCGQPARTYAG